MAGLGLVIQRGLLWGKDHEKSSEPCISNEYIVTNDQRCNNTFQADYRPCIWFHPIDANMHISRRGSGGLGLTGLQTAIASDGIRCGIVLRGSKKMDAKRVVHVVGTGTLGEPVISLLLHLQHGLEVDEITFHKNRPLLNDRMKIISLMRRGAKLAVEEEKMADFEKLGMLPTYTRQAALAQATVVIDCTAEGLGLQHKGVWYEHMPKARGFIAQGSEFGFGKMYAHGINDAALVPNADRFCKRSVVIPITWRS
jgi:hypothetical protein